MNDNPKYRVDARQSQIGVMGDHAKVDEIHFHGPSAPQSLHQIPEPTATFKGRQEELDELTEAIRESGVAISGAGSARRRWRRSRPNWRRKTQVVKRKTAHYACVSNPGIATCHNLWYHYPPS